MIDPGFEVVENVFSMEECDGIAGVVSRLPRPRHRAGARHLMRNPSIAALALDQRLLAIANRRLGGVAVPFRATLFEKSARANWFVVWHQDTALPLESRFDAREWGPWSLKDGIHYAHAPGWALAQVLALRVHLDASGSENGPLRVLPGSHQLGVLTDEQVFNHARTTAAVDCVVPRGGVLAMRPLLIHASAKAVSVEPRRVLHFEYAKCLDLAPQIRLAVA